MRQRSQGWQTFGIPLQSLLAQSMFMPQLSPAFSLHALFPIPPSQAFIPSQMPAGNESCCPCGMFEHVPTEPVTLQAWHLVVQELLQQTPSTQLLLVHSTPAPQAVPLVFFTRQVDAIEQ